MKNILLVTDSPFATSAYAIQAMHFAKRAVRAGYKVTYIGTTYNGIEQIIDGVHIKGVVGDLFGNDTIHDYIQDSQADILVTFKDPYVYHPDVMQNLPIAWMPIVPIDTEPVSEALRTILKYATYPIALTRFGFHQLGDVGISSMYAPHGIDTTLFQPGDKNEARERLGLPQDVFVASFVGANQTIPSRKNIDKIIMAWAYWQAKDAEQKREHQDAILYLHTDLTHKRGGLHVETLLKYHDVQNVRYTNPMQYMNGVSPETLRDIYQASDVLLNPASGGGFELCGVEAQACGCPVITTNFTAMRETVWAGWKIESDEAMLFDSLDYVPELAAYRFRVKPTQIARALDGAFEKRHDESLRHNARQGALNYDIEQVFDAYWLPLLKRVAKLEAQKFKAVG